MAGDTDILNRIVEAVAALDEAAYTTYANAGLLRRARKEMEKGAAASVVNTTPDTVDLAVAEYTVRMDASGLSKATCSCPAPGSCWHILVACLSLQERAPETGPSPAAPTQAQEVEVSDAVAPEVAPAAADPWLTMPEDKLRKWAGAEAYRKACKLVADDVQRVEPPEVVFRSDVRCRLMPETGLDGIISNAPARLRKAYAAAAVLAYRKSCGVESDAVATTGARSLERGLGLLDEVQKLLESAVEIGLSHLSLSMLQRLQSLSVQCRAAGFVRPSLELESCAQEIEWSLERHARADLPRLFDKMARLYALAESIRNQGTAASDVYVGTPRAKYVTSDSLELVGMGAYPWETESGFVGLTALFWSPEQQAFFSWSDSRPKHSTGGFTPAKRLDAESPWAGGGTLRRLSREAFRLENPKMSPERRLSAHAGSRVEDMHSRVTPQMLPPVQTQWADLRQAQAATRAIGLQRGGPLDAVVRIQPAKWHKPRFDETEQRLVLPLEDATGEVLYLVLPFTEMTASAIHYLESYKPGRSPVSLLCYYRVKPAEHVFPISLLEETDKVAVTDVLFASLPATKALWQKFVKEKIGRFISITRIDTGEGAESLEEHDEVALFLSPVDDYLLQCAETGTAAVGGLVPAPDADLAGVGFLRLAECLKDASAPRSLLRSRYHYLLLLDAM